MKLVKNLSKETKLLTATLVFVFVLIFALEYYSEGAPFSSIESLTIPFFTAIFFLPIFYISKYIFPPDFDRSIQAKFKRHPVASIISACIIVSILIFFIYKKILRAKWGIIDDHEIMTFIGTGDRLYIQDFIKKLNWTEIVHFGNSPRFRPTYFFLRLSECLLWGKNPMLWYAARLTILTISLSMFWILILPITDWVIGGILCAYLLTSPLWPEIFGKLGPGETYAVLGLPIYIGAYLYMMQDRSPSIKKNILYGLSLLVGSILCYGSKENFLILLIPSLYLVYLSLKRKNIIQTGFIIASIIFAFYILSSLMITFSKTAIDIYANSISPLSRIMAIFQMLQKNNGALLPLLLLLITALVLQGLHFIRVFKKEQHQTILIASFWIWVLCILYLSQLYFYNGVWPTGMRYDFPGILYIPFFIIILYWVAKKLFTVSIFQNAATFSLKTSLVISLLLIIFIKGYSSPIGKIREIVQSTNEYTQQIERDSARLNNNENYALVIESGNVWDYETIISYERFLHAYGVKNSFFLTVNGYSPETVAPGLEKQLAVDITKISQKGNGQFSPIEKLDSFGKSCYSVKISGDFPTKCELLH